MVEREGEGIRSSTPLRELFQKVRILVVGDLMLDCFLWGTVSRISPEAPVPVLDVEQEEFFPGGAANVARNLAPFCERVSVLGRIGNDNSGEILRKSMESQAIDLSSVLVSETLPTSCKTRIVARQQQIVRFDKEEICALEEEERKLLLSRFELLLEHHDLVIVQDYAKGLIDQELLESLVAACRVQGKLIVGDPNPRNHLIWRGFDAVKPNRSEAFNLAGMSELGTSGAGGKDSTLDEVAQQLHSQWETRRLLITLGDQGMAHYCQSGESLHVPTCAQQVYDVSGAGDTAIAFYAMGLAAGLSDQQCVSLANQASGIVVAKLGTASVSNDEFSTLSL